MVPPPVLFAAAVKVTGVPEQIFPGGLAVMFTDGVRFGFTAIVMVFEVAEVEVRQLPPVIVISQVTVFPLASVELVCVLDALFCTEVPLTLKS